MSATDVSARLNASTGRSIAAAFRVRHHVTMRKPPGPDGLLPGNRFGGLVAALGGMTAIILLILALPALFSLLYIGEALLGIFVPFFWR
jgi:hypothetical protein